MAIAFGVFLICLGGTEAFGYFQTDTNMTFTMDEEPTSE